MEGGIRSDVGGGVYGVWGVRSEVGGGFGMVGD
jgi:hypothetical protein